jgi:hypothetical protein
MHLDALERLSVSYGTVAPADEVIARLGGRVENKTL